MLKSVIVTIISISPLLSMPAIAAANNQSISSMFDCNLVNQHEMILISKHPKLEKNID
jgi:hypothetical protein